MIDENDDGNDGGDDENDENDDGNQSEDDDDEEENQEDEDDSSDDESDAESTDDSDEESDDDSEDSSESEEEGEASSEEAEGSSDEEANSSEEEGSGSSDWESESESGSSDWESEASSEEESGSADDSDWSDEESNSDWEDSEDEDLEWGEAAATLTSGECGQFCAECYWSWAPSDPDNRVERCWEEHVDDIKFGGPCGSRHDKSACTDEGYCHKSWYFDDDERWWSWDAKCRTIPDHYIEGDFKFGNRDLRNPDRAGLCRYGCADGESCRMSWLEDADTSYLGWRSASAFPRCMPNDEEDD